MGLLIAAIIAFNVAACTGTLIQVQEKQKKEAVQVDKHEKKAEKKHKKEKK